MQNAGRKIVFALLAVVTVSACGNRNREPELMHLRSTTGTPDEFAILPNAPLQAPADFISLPPPTPGGGNLADPNPHREAAVALGGSAGYFEQAGIASADQGLVAYASRNGVTPSIRQTLASEDLEYRRRNNGLFLERLFNINVYFDAYEDQSLDQHRELNRFRRLGVRTPSAPPVADEN
ncbi:DUF3035 domain-containing protein [Cochlodiniinecator piscidefendens]|uniref:DUF3035 domain-containing protein n=1 Tax=Cochlodiniinecator piscidefendens TaxID=2715756 RepID=UPI001409C816|nr:DUF3035 domain-containing protein [Cochlodiniinecator piscidefendens]